MASLELSTTTFSKFSRCPKAYEYYAVHKLVPPYDRVGVPLRRGIWLHSALQTHYTGGDWKDRLRALAVWALEHGVPEEATHQVYDECVAIVENYLDYYATHEDKVRGRVLLAEEPRYLKVPKFDAVLRTTMDLVIEDRKGIWVVEHKSTGEFPPVNWMSVDPQTAIDLIVLSREGKILPDGILFNYLLTKIPSVPGITKGNKKEPPRIYANAGVTTSQAFDQARDELVVAWQNWQKENEGGVRMAEIASYVDDKRKELVADGQWFRQNVVIRPVPMLVETTRDVMGILAAIRTCEERDHWPRSFHVHNCPRFCEYSDLCVSEYVNGRPSKEMRQADFRIDDGVREGR